jgi:hypothetical protein
MFEYKEILSNQNLFIGDTLREKRTGSYARIVRKEFDRKENVYWYEVCWYCCNIFAPTKNEIHTTHYLSQNFLKQYTESQANLNSHIGKKLKFQKLCNCLQSNSFNNIFINFRDISEFIKNKTICVNFIETGSYIKKYVFSAIDVDASIYNENIFFIGGFIDGCSQRFSCTWNELIQNIEVLVEVK